MSDIDRKVVMTEHEVAHPGDDAPGDPARENVVVRFVDEFNSRNWDGVAALLAADATGSIAGDVAPGELVDALVRVTLENPGVLLTRGEAGSEPVAVAWLPDGEGSPYTRVGYLSFAFAGGDESPLVEYLEYVDVPAGEDLVAEEPEPTEVSEWEDWTEWEEGAPRVDAEPTFLTEAPGD